MMSNAQLGSYDIEVSGDGQKMTVTVTIAGEVSQISVDGPEMISAEVRRGCLHREGQRREWQRAHKRWGKR